MKYDGMFHTLMNVFHIFRNETYATKKGIDTSNFLIVTRL